MTWYLITLAINKILKAHHHILPMVFISIIFTIFHNFFLLRSFYVITFLTTCKLKTRVVFIVTWENVLFNSKNYKIVKYMEIPVFIFSKQNQIVPGILNEICIWNILRIHFSTLHFKSFTRGHSKNRQSIFSISFLEKVEIAFFNLYR